MEKSSLIRTFSLLGKFMNQFSSVGFIGDDDVSDLNRRFADDFSRQITAAGIYNPWFTEEFVRYSLGALASSLEKNKIEKWLEAYPQLSYDQSRVKKVGLVLAGNIPLVGFHDVMCVIMSGHDILGKLSSKDDRLLPLVSEMLCYLEPELEKKITFSDQPLKKIDAIIATGSNNTSRYFEYYFGQYPNIIRKNRNSAGVITGNETKEDILRLADDIFLYFGLGCRNVSKIFLPRSYDISNILKHFEHYSYLYNHNKYANNYSYYKAIYLVGRTVHLDNGFLLVKEDEGYASPVGVIYYERYDDPGILKDKLKLDSELLQCVVSSPGITENTIPFGTTQLPELWDYADNVDTMNFLINLYKN